MINRVVLVGRLTRDLELRKTNSDKSVVSITIAVDNRGKTQDGQRTASFIPVTIWNELANTVAKFCHKGSLVAVDGRLLQRNFEKKDGSKGNVIEVVADAITFLEKKSDNQNNNNNSNNNEAVADEPSSDDENTTVNDDLPF